MTITSKPGYGGKIADQNGLLDQEFQIFFDDIEIKINALEDAPSGAGEANTSSNLGGGSGLATAKVGVNLPFKSLIGGTNVTLSATSTEVTINASSPVASVNSQTGVVVLDADDISDAATTNKYTTAGDITKLAGIETLADVTDTTNVTAAGALMDSEVDADLKTFALPANTTISVFGATIIDDANAAAVQTTLGLVIGTDVQAFDATILNDADIGVTVQGFTSVLEATTASYTTAEETKLSGIEALADVTDTANVTSAGALMDSEVDADLKTFVLPANTTISTFGSTLVDDTTSTIARTTLGLVIGTDVEAFDSTILKDADIGVNVQAFATVLDNTTASFLIADETKLDGIELLADVTDTANVTAAGALMDSEVDADIKTLVLPASTTISTFGASLVDDVAASNARTTLGVVIGTDVQAHSSVLDATTASFLTADETKLDGIAAGATVNSTDAFLLARANHTGTQLASTISDFDTEVGNNSAVSLNTAKITNATHTGDVAGDTALTIQVDAVDIPMLSATGTADATTFLRGDNTWGAPAGAGDMLGANNLSDVVSALTSTQNLGVEVGVDVQAFDIDTTKNDVANIFTADQELDNNNLIIGTLGKGIDFDTAGSGAAANLLDDYEEGIFTVTLSPSTSGTITINTSFNTMSYVKIGSIVNIQGRVDISSVSSPVGQLIVTGLPFTSATLTENSDSSPLHLHVATANSSFNLPTAAIITQAGTTLSCRQGSTTGQGLSLAAECKATTKLYFNGSYRAA